MDYQNRLKLSYYQSISSINGKDNIFIVKNINDNKIYIKKILTNYDIKIYNYIKDHHIKGIPHIYLIYEENNTLTIIEEYISGQTLYEFCNDENNKNNISYTFLYSVIIHLCIIIRQLHSINPPILHRDISPKNIIITPANEIYLCDLNTAKFYDANKNEDTTLLGTPDYAAPEQYGFGASNLSTDIYNIGSLMKYILTFLPHNSIFYNDTIKIISKCCEIDYKNRFPNVDTLVYTINKAFNNIKNNITNNSNHSNNFKYNKYTLPGFRNNSILIRLLATIGYLFIILISFTPTETPYNIITHIEIFISFLIIIFCFSNYLNIQKLMPLCQNKNIFIRFCGKCILTFLILFIFIFIIAIITPQTNP